MQRNKSLLYGQDGSVSIQKRPGKGGWSQTIPTKSEADPVKISLQDCLACSGCVTSAETVLLEHQSTGKSTALFVVLKTATLLSKCTKLKGLASSCLCKF